METYVKLKNFPEKLQFPAHLRETVWYEKAKNYLTFKGVMTEKEKDELLSLLSPGEASFAAYKKEVEKLYQKTHKGIYKRIEKLEKEITKYGEIFAEFPDVWYESRLIDYRNTRIQDVNDMRNLYKEGIQASFKERQTTEVALGAPPGTATEAQTPEKFLEGLTLSPQERFRHKSTFLAEVELQKLVEGRDDNTLLQGYTIYLLRFLVSVIPGKRCWFFPSLRSFDARNVYAEVSIRIHTPELEDLENMGFVKGEKDLRDWSQRLEEIYRRRKPYIYSFVPQEYVQHIGAWSALSRKFGLDLFQPPPPAPAPTPPPSPPAQGGGKGTHEKQQTKESSNPGRPMGGMFSGAPKIPTIPASVRKAYDAESEAILSHQTLISFMRGDEEVGWLFGPRLVGPNRRVPEKGVRQVYVLAAVPGDLPVVRLTVSTNWVNIKNHLKKAFSYSKIHELRERFYQIHAEIETYYHRVRTEKNEIEKEIEQEKKNEALGDKQAALRISEKKLKIREKDVATQALYCQMDRLKFLKPVRIGRLLLPYDTEKAKKINERGIRDIFPVITSVFPDSGPSNVETQVLITGKNFDYQTRIEVNGKDISTVTFINRETFVATIPPSNAGRKVATLKVVTPLGASVPFNFRYTDPVTSPSVAILKSLPPTDKQIKVIISGCNFDRHTRVAINGEEFKTDFISNKELQISLPEELKEKEAVIEVCNFNGVYSGRFFLKGTGEGGKK